MEQWADLVKRTCGAFYSHTQGTVQCNLAARVGIDPTAIQSLVISDITLSHLATYIYITESAINVSLHKEQCASGGCGGWSPSLSVLIHSQLTVNGTAQAYRDILCTGLLH